LAREGGVSVTEYSTEPPLSQASQLPHFVCRMVNISDLLMPTLKPALLKPHPTTHLRNCFKT
ncbi:hypothetical protein, partial [Pseudomonas sp.]|uniref:hypothetical protein n=1 Tax=Pseudomonas sp. TaxID=306 RepID=UPI0028A59860